MRADLALLEHLHVEAVVERRERGLEPDRTGADDGERVGGGRNGMRAPSMGGGMRSVRTPGTLAGWRDGGKAGGVRRGCAE